MASHYNINAIIIKINNVIPSYGCCIDFDYDGDVCQIITGLGESTPEAKVDLLIKSTIVHDKVFVNKTVEIHNVDADSALPNVCITKLEKAWRAAVKQEYQYHEEIG
jgi:hypothetical protein